MATFKDIMLMVSKGYKPSDIKEILTMAKELNETSPSEDPSVDIEEDSGVATTPATPEDSSKDSKEVEDKEDYKALYEKTKKELKEAQKANKARDISTEEDYKTSEDIVNEFIKNFY